jgi:hypothetical protein
MTIHKLKFTFTTLLAALCVALAPARAATVLFEDQFNGASWDTSKWTAYDSTNFLQRTQFGNLPTIGTENSTSFARIRLDSYDPDPNYSGDLLRGTEMMSKTNFTPGDGLEIEARVRGNNLPRGIVFAFFTYGERGTYPNNLRDEIDYEFLTNFNKDTIWLNIWDDYNKESNTGPNQSSMTTAPGLDRTGWHVYKIRWTSTRVDWYVDGTIVRTSTNIVPTDPMQVRFNIWAGSTDWPTAYDANLPVTSNASNNQSFNMDVDWVQVRTLSGAVVGNGTGLTGKYFNNMDFTGTSIQRIDPQVNFDWGQGSPSSQIGADTFTARWTGQVQAQYSETYTFTTRTDDGVRLWVNNKLIIDQWHNGSADDFSGQINLVAGQKYDIKMEYYDDEGAAVAQLSWSSPSTAKVFIPKSQLYPSSSSTTNTPPAITITSPVNNQLYQAAPLFKGTAHDAETSVLALSGLLYDQSRAKYWNGTQWTATAANFPVSLANGGWSYQLPALLDGRFTLRMAATDTQHSSSSKALTFSINNKKPPVIVIQSPVNGRVYAAKPAFNGTAKDAETSVLQVQGMIYDSTRKLYWNGSAWGTTAVYFLLSGKETWSYTLPTLQNGSYIARVLATDTSRNSSTSAVSFTVKTSASTYSAPASVTLSSASAKGNTITLVFTGALDEAARDAANWQVTVNGESVVPTVNVSDQTVTLTLPAALAKGDDVTVSWLDGSWQGKAG